MFNEPQILADKRHIARWSFLSVGALTVTAGAGLFAGFWQWIEYSKTSEAVASALIVLGFLPWVVALRRGIWAYRAADGLGSRIVIYALVVLSIIAFPAGLMLVNHFFAGPAAPWGTRPEPVSFACLQLSLLTSIGAAALAFLVQLVRDRWHLMATAVGAAFQFVQYVYLAST